MTTGRINQVTIVRRGWPRHPRMGPRISYWRRPRGPRRPLHERARPHASVRHPLSPSRFPRTRSAQALQCRPGLCAPGGGPARRFSCSASPAGGCLQLLTDRSSHRPAVHRAHPGALGTSPERFLGVPAGTRRNGASRGDCQQCSDPGAA
jgi:hypothetical protein